MNIMLDKNAFMPERAHDLDAGYDLRTPIDFKIHCYLKGLEMEE